MSSGTQGNLEAKSSKLPYNSQPSITIDHLNVCCALSNGRNRNQPAQEDLTINNLYTLNECALA